MAERENRDDDPRDAGDGNNVTEALIWSGSDVIQASRCRGDEVMQASRFLQTEAGSLETFAPRAMAAGVPNISVETVAGNFNMADILHLTHNVNVVNPQILNANFTALAQEDPSGYTQIKDQSWEEVTFECEVFRPTSSYNKALSLVEEKGLLFIMGPSRSGKTMIGKAVLRKQKDLGRTPLVLKSYKEFRKHVGGDRKQIILLDDIFGDEEFEYESFKNWSNIFIPLQAFAQKGKCLTIFTINTTVLKELALKCNKSQILQNGATLDLDNSQPLSDEEKISLFEAHMQERSHEYSESLLKDVLAIDTSRYFFPDRCSKFSAQFSPETDLKSAFKCQSERLPATEEENLMDILIKNILIGDAEKVRDLLSRGAPADGEDKSGNRPLHEASKLGHERIMRMLILFGASVGWVDTDQRVALHYVVSEGFVDCVDLLLEKGAEVNVVDRDLWSPIHFAASKGQTAILQKLVERGTKVSCQTKTGDSPLHVACRSGNLDIVRILLSSGVDVDLTDDLGQTALHVVAFHGFVDLAVELIKNGADINKADKESKTPFFISCEEGNTEMVNCLLEQESINTEFSGSVLEADMYKKFWRKKDGSFVNIELTEGTLQKFKNELSEYTPFKIACANGHHQTVAALLKSGKLTSVDEEDVLKTVCILGRKSVFQTLIEHDFSMTADFIDKEDLIGFAVLCGHHAVLTKLLDAGGDVNALNLTGVQHLTSAVLLGHTDIVTQLIDAGGDVNAVTSTRVQPLHLAAFAGHKDIVSRLIHAGGNVNAATSDGMQPLHFAASSGHTDIVTKLIDAGGDVNAATSDGMQPLHFAASSGHTDIVTKLIDAGGDVNAADSEGWQPLRYAALYGHTDIVTKLIDAGGDVKAVTLDGVQTLHAAASSGHTDIVTKLIDAGGDVNAVTSDGFQPLHLAAKAGHIDIMAKLISAGAEVNISREGVRMSCIQAAFFGGSVAGVSLLEDSGASILLQHGADLRARNANNKTPLNLAYNNGHYNVVSDLVLSENFDAASEEGNTFFHRVCEDGKKDLASILIERGVSVNAANTYGSSPLHIASRSGQSQTVALLLSKGADVNAVDAFDRTSLYLACQGGHAETATLLLGGGADVNKANNFGMTPLHAAFSENQSTLTELLISNGASLDTKDIFGRTAFDCESSESSAGNRGLEGEPAPDGAASNSSTQSPSAIVEDCSGAGKSK